MIFYVLNEEDATEINRRRIEPKIALHDHANVQLHMGSEVFCGDTFPAVIVRNKTSNVSNLQVYLDGTDTYWAIDKEYDSIPKSGCWHQG